MQARSVNVLEVVASASPQMEQFPRPRPSRIAEETDSEEESADEAANDAAVGEEASSQDEHSDDKSSESSAKSEDQSTADVDAAKSEETKDKQAADDKSGDSSPKKPEPEEAKEVEKQSEAKKSAPKPFVVKRKPLKIEEEIEGYFVAKEMEQISVRPEVWTRFTVLERVDHGTEVKKGDLLVRFDAESLNDKLADDAIDQRLSELSLMRAEEAQPREERLLELAYDRAQRDYKELQEDFKYYQETDRPFAERIANYRYDSAKEDLASQEEELTQLKKMYEADELTEDTEAIVLRRQEFEVSTAKLMFELQEASRDYSLNVTLPRNDKMYETSLERARLDLEKAKMERELGITRGKYELEQKRASRARSVKNGAELLSDRSLMELRAPRDGTVYYGRCKDGRWSEINSIAAKLVPYGTISTNSVLMTIVEQRPLYVLAQLSEKSLIKFKEGMQAEIKPGADEKRELEGKVEAIAGIPGGSRKYNMQVELVASELPDWLVAGMSCSMTVTTYENEKALQIPAKLVNSDDDDEDEKYVMILTDKSDQPLRRSIKVGHKKEKYVEVLEGLSVGEKIVPEEKSADKSKDEE